jgi:peptidyl-dipeptidase A
MTGDYERKLDEIETHLEDLAAAEGKDVFDLYYRHADVDTAVHEKRKRDFLLRPEVAETCDGLLESAEETALRRRAQIVRNWVNEMRAQTDEIIDLQAEIQKIVIETKPVLDGEEIPRHQKTKTLFKNDDRERRRRALFSEGPLREKLAARSRRLYRLRNEAAQALGYDDYPSLALASEDLTVAELRAIFDTYERESRKAYELLASEGCARFGLECIEPWDLNYVTEKITSADDKYFPRAKALPSLREVVRGFGRDLDELEIPIHEDADIPYAGLCFSIRVPEDIRILVNLQDGLTDLVTLYHEFGHAAHRKFGRRASYALKAGDAGLFAEAMADTWGLLVFRPAWWRAFTEMPAGEGERMTAAAEMAYASRLRRFMARQDFELTAYVDADGDLATALDEGAERFLGFRYDDPEYWAEQYFPLLYPVYSKNYMLARVIQRAVHRHLESEFGELLGEPKVFDFLVENFYADGALLTWKEKLAAVGLTL